MTARSESTQLCHASSVGRSTRSVSVRILGQQLPQQAFATRNGGLAEMSVFLDTLEFANVIPMTGG